MGKGSSSTWTRKEMKEKAKNRVDDLQGMFADLQSARKESRSMDEVGLLEQQVHQMLNDWKSELDQPSPASSLQAGSLGSFSSEIYRLLHLGDEEDDATSALPVSKLEHVPHKVSANDTSLFEGFMVNQGPQRQDLQFTNYCKDSNSTGQSVDPSTLYPSQSEYLHSYDLTQEFEQNYSGFVDPLMYGNDALGQDFGYLPNMCPPPSAFLGPKCSLWDCTRPAQDRFDYCSSDHAALALEEGPPGMRPVLRPNGIGLKENLLFSVLNAKAESKDVGIPECEGAATAKCPWNAPELFDLAVLEGESIREWLFFDKPRRAFEIGNRKQRSLSDYKGRGWHESRKQMINDFNGQKRSYYMDPQPRPDFEWHLYEYEILNFDACALYRLEYKRVSDKKSPKGKSSPNDSVADLQKQMGRLTAESPMGNKRSGKAKAKASPKDVGANAFSVPNQAGLTNEGFDAVSDYLVADLDGYYDQAKKG